MRYAAYVQTYLLENPSELPQPTESIVLECGLSRQAVWDVLCEQSIFSKTSNFSSRAFNPVGRPLAFCVFDRSNFCTSWRISSACGRIPHLAHSANMLWVALSEHCTCTAHVPQLNETVFIVINHANKLRASGFTHKYFRTVSSSVHFRSCHFAWLPVGLPTLSIVQDVWNGMRMRRMHWLMDGGREAQSLSPSLSTMRWMLMYIGAKPILAYELYHHPQNGGYTTPLALNVRSWCGVVSSWYHTTVIYW